MEDNEAEIELLKMIAAGIPEAVATMKRYAAAASMLIAGNCAPHLRAPEPIVQVGFKPDEDEMRLITLAAESGGRDLIHISCRADGSGQPTGMIAVVYFENGRARPHRRAGLLCAPGSSEVVLAGVSDMEDERCHFILRPGEKMVRTAGYPVDDLLASMIRAGELWEARANSPDLRDCEGETLAMYTALQVPRWSFGSAAVRKGGTTH